MYIMNFTAWHIGKRDGSTPIFFGDPALNLYFLYIIIDFIRAPKISKEKEKH